MGFYNFLSLILVISSVYGQNNYYQVCISSLNQNRCQSLDKDGSRVYCNSVDSKIDCALKLARGQADFGVFSEEEVLLLSQQQPNDHRVIASLRAVNRELQDSYAFEAVVVVASNHTTGFEGLRGGMYCHPGLDEKDLRWSPRVLRAFERKTARTDRCVEQETFGKTAEELEVRELSRFFSAACRPGAWSANATIDANLKRTYSTLCSICGPSAPSCTNYTYDLGVTVAGVSNNNRHIQALECMSKHGSNGVAYVAWQHVREFFNIRSPQLTSSYALLCPDGTLAPLNTTSLNSIRAPCSLVKQHYPAIVATSSRASALLGELRTWWPNGDNPGGNTWQSILWDELVGGTGIRVYFEDGLPTPVNFTTARALTSVDATATCMPSRRWCTTSEPEHSKCTWLRQAAYTLGLEPAISCQQRQSAFQCLEDIRDSRADFISLDSNYGFLARQHYKLSPVKLLQNALRNPASLTRIAALVKETTAQANVTRFENLKGKRACFPEFGGIAYVAFVRTAHERGVISATQCDYARAVGELFDGACAPGALDASHTLYEGSSFNATNLCTSCRAATTTTTVSTTSSNNFTCSWDYSNLYYATNGTLACLADPHNDVAFLETQNLENHLRTLNLQASNFRVLCRNNTLASTTGINVDDNCLLALVVDGEVLARRNDPQQNSLSSLLELLDLHFGYNAASATQLINLEIYSSFDGIPDLLFKNSAIGLTEPSSATAHEPAKNYFELFRHLESCTGSANALATQKGIYSVVMLVVMSIMTFWVV